MDKIKRNIEKLREELNILLSHSDRYSEGEVLKVSQQLDELIYQYVDRKN